MYRDCQVTDDGDIYEIQKDGSISKVGSLHETSNSGHSSGWLWFFLIIAIGAAVVFILRFKDAESKIENLTNLYSESQEDYYMSRNNYNSISSELQTLKSNLKDFPILISDVEVGNVYDDGTIETSYGGYIYSSRTMYLKPRIRYVGTTSGQITLKVKLYNKYGDLSRGNNSPYGYTYKWNIDVSPGNNTCTLNGWGNSSMGNWPSGNYKYEIWYNNRCLAVKEFTVH